MRNAIVRNNLKISYSPTSSSSSSSSFYVVTCDVDRDVSTAYCLSSSGDEVDWLSVTFAGCSAMIGWFSESVITNQSVFMWGGGGVDLTESKAMGPAGRRLSDLSFE